jgi:hypothetical protein
MPPPDFAIVGAPKAGTTSLFRYLVQHPRIFIPGEKEIHYFGSDIPQAYRQCDTMDEYQAFFADAGPDQLCGEASVFYMHSADALENLQQHNPKVKCIAVVRNPVDHFLSWHKDKYKHLQEQYADPEPAWYAQDARLEGRDIPENCVYPESLIYRRFCALGSKLEHFMRAVPVDRRLIILNDDLASDTANVFLKIMRFLGVEDIGDIDNINFRRANTRVQPRSMVLARFLRNPPRSLVFLRRKLKPVLNRHGIYPSRFVHRLNSRPVEETIDPAFRRMLVDEFEPEIQKIEACTGRDLSHWRK